MKSTQTETLPTKNRILEATLNIISEEGFQYVTIRKIAEKADVNVAAVNYHFGTKDNVINEALEYLMQQVKKIFRHLEKSIPAPEERLKLFINDYSKSLEKYPDQIKNLIYQSIYDKTSGRNTYQEYLKDEGIYLIKKTLHELTPEDDDTILSLKAVQIISCLSFPVLLGKRGKEMFNIDITVHDIRAKYITQILGNIIHN
jgi:TetR/AcrR family transcriptional regulator, regulator of cefoperazone and chloramphenicol sensitivity